MSIKIYEDKLSSGTYYTIYEHGKCIASMVMSDDPILVRFGGKDWQLIVTGGIDTPLKVG